MANLEIASKVRATAQLIRDLVASSDAAIVALVEGLSAEEQVLLLETDSLIEQLAVASYSRMDAALVALSQKDEVALAPQAEVAEQDFQCEELQEVVLPPVMAQARQEAALVEGGSDESPEIEESIDPVVLVMDDQNNEPPVLEVIEIQEEVPLETETFKAVRALERSGHVAVAAIVRQGLSLEESDRDFVQVALGDKDVPGWVKAKCLHPKMNELFAQLLMDGQYGELVGSIVEPALALLREEAGQEEARAMKRVLISAKRLFFFEKEDLGMIERLLEHAELPGFAQLACADQQVAMLIEWAKKEPRFRRAVPLLKGLQEILWERVNELLEGSFVTQEHVVPAMPVRTGKTARRRQSGALDRHAQNKAKRAEENRERSLSRAQGGKKGQGKKGNS